jgi:predicted acetyltransferase
MGWSVRPATADDVPALVRADWAAFGNRPNEAQIEGALAFLEVDRTFVAVEGDRVVGSAGGLSLELTVPGPATVPTAGVTYVGVMPTHRRQGILTALMAELVDDARRRGEPLAALLASESTIYGRFGFGVAVTMCSVEIERPHARLRRTVDVAGRTRLLEQDEMAGVLPAIWDRYRRAQPGEVSRSEGWWARRLDDDPTLRRGGAGPRFAVVWEGDAGYVTYRIQDNWGNGFPHHVLTIEDLVATTPDVRAGLWQYCFGVDLVGVVRALNLPLDDPLRWSLVDPRRLRVTAVHDLLWVNVLDVEAALSARSYGSEQPLVIDVAGEGRYRLAAGGCRRTEDLADLGMEAADLGSAYLGGVSFATLARAGRVAELTAGAVARADAIFATAPGPSSCTGF